MQTACSTKIKNKMAKNVDPDETARNGPSHLDRHCINICVGLQDRKGKEQLIFYRTLTRKYGHTGSYMSGHFI